MDFGILGLLDVRATDGESVDVRGQRRRALLIYLLVHRGMAVSIDRISDDVWEGDPSPGARSTVKTYVSQLRRVLAAHGGPAVRSKATTYQLDVADDHLDAARFDRLVDSASTDADVARRLRSLDDALALWRGPALTEVCHVEWAHSAAVSLDAARLRAQILRAEILLEMGRPAMALPELERLAIEHQLDETVAMTLATARYRAGNQAGALSALARVKRRLADELGVVPADAVLDLEHRILRHDVDLLPMVSLPQASTTIGATLPTGIVTFLYIDIVDSTPVLEKLGDSADGAVLTELRGVLREVWLTHGGHEFRTNGDAHFVSFARASDAVAAAGDAQRTIGAHPWAPSKEPCVRIGVHTGEAELTNGDYVGLAFHIAARVCSAASGRQVLLTDATVSVAAPAAVRDLGPHRLLGVVSPIGLYQLVGEGLADDFPPPRTLSVHSNNLPLTMDELVGRQREISDVEQALEHHRLVTLSGAGGAGKTRLALDVAARHVHRFADGVWLVELGREQTDKRVAAAAAAVLNVGGRAGVPIEVSLVDWLRTRHLLLVLDNCEHVLDGAAALATAILQACPNVHVFATSREHLGVRGEQTIVVPPLAVGAGAEHLFEVRARAAAPGTELDGDLVERVCSRLDGLPLAIELAAARLRGLSLAEIDERLDDRFHLLVSGLRGDLPHHRTLEAVVAWSYDLLSESDQLVFASCSVFADGFDLAAAARVAGGNAFTDAEVVDAMSRLVDKSLVVHTTDQDGHTRYRLLETLRQYGRDRLAASGETEDRLDRLSEWAMGCIEELERQMRTPRQDAALRHINPDRANLRVAFDRAIEHHDHVTALRIVSAVSVVLPSERRDLIGTLINSVGDSHIKEVAQAHLTSSNLALEQGDWPATVDEANAAAVGFAAIGDRRLASWSRYFESFGTWGLGDDIRTDNLLGDLLEEFRALGDEFGLAYTLWTSSQRQPDLARADLLAAEADGLLRALGARFALAHNLEGRALIAIQAERLERVPNHLREALLILADAGNLGCTAHCLEAIGLLLAEQHRPLTDVAELVGAAEALREASEHRHRPWELRGHHAVLAELAGTPDRQGIDEAFTRGRAHDLASAVKRAERLLASEPGPGSGCHEVLVTPGPTARYRDPRR